MKTCKSCAASKNFEEFYAAASTKDGLEGKCKTCKAAADAGRRETAAYKRQQRRKHYRAKYGITVEDYDRLFELQDGKCAICGDSDTGKFNHLCVDHDHKTGEVRGLLCNPCNKGIGCLRDDKEILKSAISYLGDSQTWDTLALYTEANL